MKKNLAYIGIIVPLVLMAAWTSQFALVANRGLSVSLAVGGYDPRDLLSGHFLQYQVDYGPVLKCDSSITDEICVCLAPDSNAATPDGTEKAFWAGSCNEIPNDGSCRKWLRGHCHWSGLEVGIERYYFPENFTHELARVPPKSTIDVALDGHGGGVVTGMYVDREPLLDYAKRTQEQEKKPK